MQTHTLQTYAHAHFRKTSPPPPANPKGRHMAKPESDSLQRACDHFINLLKTLPISFALFFGKRF
jgi:hypothetical protein